MEFRRRIHIAPGVCMNLSKYGVGVKVEVKGVHDLNGGIDQHMCVLLAVDPTFHDVADRAATLQPNTGQ